MRLGPFKLLTGATVLALIPVVLLVGPMTAPVAPGCFEWCTLGQDLATFAFLVVCLVWLFVVLLIAWWNSDPMVAVASAVAASVTLGLATLVPFGPISLDAVADALRALALVLSLGFQLPPVWRLTAHRASRPIRLLVWIMGAAVAVAMLSPVVLGTSLVWSQGPTVTFAADAVFGVARLLIAIALWRAAAAGRSVLAPLVVAGLPILLLPAAIAVPGDLGYVVFLHVPLSALAWLWIAIVWLRSDRGSRAPLPPTRAPAA